MAKKRNRAAVLRGYMGAHAPTGTSPNAKKYEQARAELAQLMTDRQTQETTDRITEFAQRLVAKAPPLSAEQRERITLALRKDGA
jgi:hypothetical protein